MGRLEVVRRFHSNMIHFAEEGNSKRLEDMLKEGAHVDLHKDDGETPLSIAANSGHSQVVQLLLSWGEDMLKYGADTPEGAAEGVDWSGSEHHEHLAGPSRS